MDNIFYNPGTGGSDGSGFSGVYAQVLDIILNEEHDDYDESGFNVGLIRYKPISIGSVSGKKEDAYYALPKEISLQEYPLIGEIVIIEKILNRNFYSRRVNINKLVNGVNTFPNLKENIRLRVVDNTRIQQAQGDVMQHTENVHPEPSGSFNSRNEVRPLKHFSGDLVLQGKFGTSIRMSSAQIESALNGRVDSPVGATSKLKEKIILGPSVEDNHPIIILTAGQHQDPTITTNSPVGLVMEDINRDETVFVMSTKQNINFFHSTTDTIAHFKGYSRENRNFIPPTIESDIGRLTVLGGNQLLLNSSRVVVNSKLSDILLSANLNVHMMANDDVSIDSGREVLITSKKISLLANDSNSKPEYYSAVLAEELIDVLREFINAFLGPSIGMGTGTITASGDLRSKLAVVRASLNDIKSSLVQLEK